MTEVTREHEHIAEVKREHRLAAIEAYGGIGPCCRKWAEDGAFEAALHERQARISRSIADAEQRGAERERAAANARAGRLTEAASYVLTVHGYGSVDPSPGSQQRAMYQLRAALSTAPQASAEQVDNCGNCWTCTADRSRMLICPTCGNKRCPKANDHTLACSGSNEPGQPGSAFAAPQASTEQVILRPVVRWFAEQMELKLRENEHKGGWHDDDPARLAERIVGEYAELEIALGGPLNRDGWLKVIAESADIANMAMMVADHYRDGGPSIDQGRTLASSAAATEQASPSPAVGDGSADSVLAPGWRAYCERTVWGSRVAYNNEVGDTVELFQHELRVAHGIRRVPRAVLTWLLAGVPVADRIPESTLSEPAQPASLPAVGEGPTERIEVSRGRLAARRSGDAQPAPGGTERWVPKVGERVRNKKTGALATVQEPSSANWADSSNLVYDDGRLVFAIGNHRLEPADPIPAEPQGRPEQAMESKP